MNSAIRVLYVEDDPAEIELASLATSADELNFEFHVLSDGEAALQYVALHSPTDGPFHPDLVLLDLNLPRVKGHEVLRAIRRQSTWATMPVVILSGGVTPREVELLEGSNPAAILSKGTDFDAYRRVFREILDLWKSRPKP